MKAFKFQKVCNVRLNINYDWMLVIESIEDLNSFYQESMSVKIGSVWSNLFDVQNGKAHFDNKLGFLINLEAEVQESVYGKRRSLIDLTTITLGKIWEAKAKAILDSGRIYINKCGGFFPYSEDIEVIEEFTGSNYLFPQYTERDIRVKQWEGGKHWYAYVGDLHIRMKESEIPFGVGYYELDENGETISKWFSEKDAIKVARAYLYRLKDKQFELKS